MSLACILRVSDRVRDSRTRPRVQMAMEIDDSAVARFVSATSCEPAQAQFFLEACGGNYERALEMHRGRRCLRRRRRFRADNAAIY